MPGEMAAPLTTSSVASRDWKASWEYHFFQAGAAESQSWRTVSLGSGVGEGLVDMICHSGRRICGCKEGNRISHRGHRGWSAEDTEKEEIREAGKNPHPENRPSAGLRAGRVRHPASPATRIAVEDEEHRLMPVLLDGLPAKG